MTTALLLSAPNFACQALFPPPGGNGTANENSPLNQNGVANSNAGANENGGANSNGSGNDNAALDNANSNSPPPVSFRARVLPILTANCVECHRPGGSADQQGISMRLTPTQAWASTVGQQSSQNSALTRIVAGQPEQSVLYLKISSDTPPIGVRMPYQGAPLREADIETIRLWIEEGALDN